MKDIAIYKTIHISESDGVHLQQFVQCGQSSDLYKLDLMDFDIFQFTKFVDGDLLTLQLSSKILDGLCQAWLAHRQTKQNLADEAKADQPE